MTRTTSRRLGGLAALVAVPMLAFSLAACSANQVAPSDPAPTPAAGTQTLTEWQLAYAQCMRDHGVDVQDPSGGPGGGVMPGAGNAATDQAADTCTKKLGNPPAPTEADRKAADDAYLAWARQAAQCYRENGYDVPDPAAGEQLQAPSDAPDSVRSTCGGGGMSSQYKG